MDRDRVDPAALWDGKYQASEYLFGTRPNAFLVDQSYRLSPGSKILCPGDGEGRNGVWLAGQGHKVVSVDASPRGLQKATKLALDRHVFLSTVCADLIDWEWQDAAYDAVVSIFLHLPSAERRRIHRGMADTLKPGGLVILEAFAPAQAGRPSGGPKDPDLLYDADVLRADFDGLDVLQLEEVETVLNEGVRHQGPATVVRLVARRA